jgi:hypothetical protein
VSTLAAVISLHEAKVAPAAVSRALTTIPQLLARLGEDANETVGFEVIAPYLLDQCSAMDLEVPANALPAERERRAVRMATGIEGTAVFSFEAMDRIPPEAVRFISPRGSLLASPSAAAAFLAQYPGTPRLWEHLTWLVEQNRGGVPAVHPLDSFAHSWSCWHMDLSGQGDSPEAQRLRNMSIQSWSPIGASFSDDFPLPNSDDTAINFIIQSNVGMFPDPQVFAPFITQDGARCYYVEYDMSVSANIHILLALRAAPPSPHRDEWIEILLRYIRHMATKRDDGLLADKWHVSPFYTTSHGILATHGLDEQLCDRLLDALLRAQRPDGIWGEQDGSAEEVAYGLTALCLSHRPRASDAIEAGAAALKRLKGQPDPALWIGKSLYLPRPVVETAVEAAHLLVTDIIDLPQRFRGVTIPVLIES